MVSILATLLVVTGAGILVASLWPVQKLIQQLPAGKVRQNWLVLRGFTFLFILGYLGYLSVSWNRHANPAELLVPGVFFFGACFVWVTTNLSLQTAIDIRRITLLEQENITDALTGIHNRRYLERQLAEEIGRAQRYSLALSILVIDMDHFKRVNDTHGHPAGDQVLKTLGALIRETIRTYDIAARYGGEEFLIIAPSTTATDVLTLAERLRERVESHPFALEKETLALTVSIGVAGLCKETNTVTKFIQVADEALYQAKQQGRNRIVLAASTSP